MGSKEESDMRIQRLHGQDRKAEGDGKVVIRRFMRLKLDRRPRVMRMAEGWEYKFKDVSDPVTWEEETRVMYRHIQDEDWGEDRPPNVFMLVLAEALQWALHVEEVRADTQTQLNNYEAAALKDQVERGRTDA
jgi:hypothetical protein